MVARHSTVIGLGLLTLLSACESRPRDTTKELDVSRGLLLDVPPEQARKLEQYNEVFLRRAGYFAARYRIVVVDADALDDAKKISVRLFPDVEPIVITPVRAKHFRGLTLWYGEYGRSNEATFSLEAWAVKSDGTVSKATTGAVSQDADFWSLTGGVFDEDGTIYDIKPLEFTPRYSVVLEWARNRPWNPIDTVGQNPPPMTDDERLAWKRYAEAMDALPNEEGKRVLADAP